MIVSEARSLRLHEAEDASMSNGVPGLIKIASKAADGLYQALVELHAALEHSEDMSHLATTVEDMFSDALAMQENLDAMAGGGWGRRRPGRGRGSRY